MTLFYPFSQGLQRKYQFLGNKKMWRTKNNNHCFTAKHSSRLFDIFFLAAIF